MLEFLTENLPYIAAGAFLLLLVCCALLIAVLIRQQAAARRGDALSGDIAARLNHQEEGLRSELGRQQQTLLSALSENGRAAEQRAGIISARLDVFDQSQDLRLSRMASTLDTRLTANDQRAEQLRASLSAGMETLRQENAQKLEQVRQTVDEKLHETLNRRLGESFTLVNQRLEQVYKGLGEMQTLASGVGDLKRVLTNVKTRGIWGEMQLGALMEQMLSPSQYAENVQVVPGSAERVEFAVILPGAEEGKPVYLPIDSKFPVDPYERLLQATEAGEAEQVKAASAELYAAIRTEAKRIAKKYIAPPHTTDFAVMFLATEGLYAEAMRCHGLMEELQRQQRVLIAGPSTLTALLSSLQVGFRTLAIEQRSADVWLLLGAVKTEFARFAELLDQTQQRLHQAGDSIEKAARRTRTISRKLRAVEALDDAQTRALLGPDDSPRDEEE